MRYILCPIAFTDASRTIIDHALELCADRSARLELLHVVDPSLHFGAAALPPADPGELGAAREARMADLVADLRATGHEVNGEIRIGLPGEEIVAFAESARVDLIVIGVHRLRELGVSLMGGTAETVIAAAPCPVLTVNLQTLS